jgi:hypothetical protein
MKRRILPFSVLLFAGLSLINCPSAYGHAISLLIDPACNNERAVSELVTAIKTVRASGVPGKINLFSKGVYTLTQPDNWEYGPNALPQISGDITINGQGATLQRHTNAPKFRFFYVSGGLSYETNTRVGLPAGTLRLNHLTLRGGLAKGGNGASKGGGGGGMGGAIFNQGTLAMTRVSLVGNTAFGGLGGAPGSGGGGGGIGEDATNNNGGGFGGPFIGRGGTGGAGAFGGGSGGGGGFRPCDNGSNASAPVIPWEGFPAPGGGYGGLGGYGGFGGHGDGGNGAWGGEEESGVPFGCAGGDFGFGGRGNTNSIIDWSFACGGGGGIGGGGGHLGFASADGAGGFGGGGGGGGEECGAGGFGGGSGSGGSGGGGPGFAGGWGQIPDKGGGGGGGLGGAIFNHRGLLTLTNCTITANAAQGGDSPAYVDTGMGPLGLLAAGSGYGGGIFNLNGTVILDGCTLSSNCCDPGYQLLWFWNENEIWAVPADAVNGSARYDFYGNKITDGTAGGAADGGALYNLAFGNKIEDGTASTATVTLVNTVLTNSSTGPLVVVLGTNDSYVVLTNSFTLNDLVNNEVDGLQTNTATVIFSINSPAVVHIDVAGAESITAATYSQAALLSAAAFSVHPEFQFNVVGVPGYNYVVQASTNLSDWFSLQTNIAPFLFVDQVSPGCPTRFYRAVY